MCQNGESGLGTAKMEEWSDELSILAWCRQLHKPGRKMNNVIRSAGFGKSDFSRHIETSNEKHMKRNDF